MITAPSALLECEAQETSTTDEELAGLRAANGSIERRGALSIPDYGEKKLPRARHRGQERRHPRAAGGDPSPPGRAGLRAMGIEPHFFDRNYEKGLEWYRISASSKIDTEVGHCHPGAQSSVGKMEYE
ncbi:heparan sulfate glucosamine 3-O-sulfotransferase 4-like isoform X5 [Equus caballus]|uniref:heparan sulfate glucosamine 3-O-sulfotransferase 4-like isoform X5 n=1 Tax=Equus caballus TaxID=9796 RepID=UPI0038B242C1